MEIPHSAHVPQTAADFPHTDWENGANLPAGLAERPLSGVRASAAAAYPDRIAVVEHGPNPRRWTHRTLDFLVTRWAARLESEGVTPGTPVGLCTGEELETPVGFLAILEAGGVVVPLDPSLPPGRRKAMTEGAGCGIVLVAGGNDLQAFAGARTLNLSRDPGDYRPQPVPGDPDRAAAIFHTSGSTGRPKPVVLSHRALSARMLSMIEWFGIAPGEVVCAASSLAFDPFLQQLFFAICTGGALWLPERVSLLDPSRFWSECAEQGVTHLNLVPSQLEPLLRCPPAGGLPALRRLVVGGERMSPDLPSRIAAALGPVAIYNMYGPTEATVDATGYRVDPAFTGQDVPIGAPLPGCRVRILDERLQRVPVGVAGELYIGGAGLAIGYLGMPEETARAFLADPFGGPGDRLYRTGDSACWLPNGEIAFLGRRDDQVKIRGQRIEMGEVEAVLRAFPDVSSAAVGKWDDAPGGPALIAHFAGAADVTELRAWLAERLPAAAVPARLVRMDSLPVLPSGKVDRRALPLPVLAPAARHSEAQSIEQSIAGVWAGLLGVATVNVTANLFETGAHSLQVAQAVAAIEAATGKPVHAVDLFRFPTVASLARYLSGEASDRSPSDARPARGGDIAIVGVAFRFPGASDCQTFWAGLLEGQDYVRRFEPATLRDRGAPACLLDHPDFVPAHAALDDTGCFDPLPFGYSLGEAAGIDPQQRLLLELAWHALEDAGCDPAAEWPVGVFAGVGFNAYLVDNLRGLMGFAGGPDRFSTVVGSDKDFAATRIAYKLGLTGPALTVNSACSTALSAIAMAVDSLRAGRCRAALAGACSFGMFSPFGHVYAEGGIASRTGVCRPFDALADGIVGGAGAAVLALMRREDAVAGGNRIYAVIRGIGIANDGAQKAAFSAPSVDGQAAAIAAALADAGVSPGDIGFVEGHGTGTALGDPIEVAALNLVFRGCSGKTLLGSVKGNVGHLDAAAGMAGLIKAMLAVRHGTVPPTAHFTTPNPRIPFDGGPFRVNTAAEPWPGAAQRLRLAGVSAFGMGGTNIHVVLGPAPEAPPPSPSSDPVLLTISAATPTARDRLAAGLSTHLNAPTAEVASTLARRRAMRHRRAIVGGLTVDGDAPGGAVAASFLFPGQGAQRTGMAGALYRGIPAFRAVLDDAESIVGRDLLSLLLTEGGGEAAAALSETERTQPALFLVEFAMAKALEAFGVFPTALLGHSIGEYVAACLAGVMEFEDALRLVAVRGRLMASAPRGAMLAVSLPEADLLPLLAQSGADLAAVNSARQCVASGTEAQIGALARLLASTGQLSTRLPVSHAFHSALMEPVRDAFAEEAAKVRLSPPSIPIVSNLTGDWLSPQDATDPAYWARHLRGTVRFAAGLRCLAADPARVLVEAGPGAALTHLARGAGVAESHAIATLPPGSPDGYVAFLGALGRLWVAGMPIDRLAAAGNATRRVSLPGYPFERVRLWIEPGTTGIAEPAQETSPAVRQDLPLRPDSAAAVIADVWRDLLGVRACGPDDDFLALGGDSLIAVRIAARLRQRLGCEVAPSAVFREGTVGGLARLLSSVQSAAAPEPREEGWL